MTISGSLMKAQDNLRTLLSNVGAFQTWVGAANATEALDHIYHSALPPPANGNVHTLAELQGYRPYALIGTSPDEGYIWEIESVGSGNFGLERGTLMVLLVQDVPSLIAADPSAVDVAFLTTIGDIIDGLVNDNGVDAFFNFNRIAMSGPERAHEDEAVNLGDFEEAQLLIEWRRAGAG